MQRRENVARTCSVLATLQTGTKLAIRAKQIDVVAPDESLSHSNDGGCQPTLRMVIRGVLTDVTTQLGHFDFANEAALEAGKQDLALRRLEAINKARNAAGPGRNGVPSETPVLNQTTLSTTLIITARIFAKQQDSRHLRGSRTRSAPC